MSNEQDNDKHDEMDDWEAAMAEQEKSEQDTSGVKTADLEELSDDSDKNPEERRKLDAILDIPVTISMEVGRSQISIRNLLQLNQGSVVELERVAGEPLDVLVNGTLIAHGEVVVVNDKFGIRLTDVISQLERIRKLR
ncbi:flagellar motor switch protein FliN [Aliidiomarina maris]|uniref:Flagellar motor switch protein FliN n=1 Tax=Aliidiomarina maris TaxID=531312 RepID=A0A327WRS2_9GAMM|nr:flagellar motor switch protein FliN [Aliidiomarina maris]MBA3987500.1 flagellar motor switch protein FliN [Idiomarina sp.]MCL5051129.1 flagellar motor switch protein FliN [Bacillota bacterium]RAJ94610.1 flagellar motor switch protein FliN/FliY [Aliidiomarina maris]RUO19714.1 flagellar motor switch protein FliN [Aliidiomarina maris]